MSQSINTKTSATGLDIGSGIISGVVTIANNASRTGTVTIGNPDSNGVINLSSGGEIRIGNATTTTLILGKNAFTGAIHIGQDLTSGTVAIGNGSNRTGSITIGGATPGQTGLINIHTAGLINIGGHTGSQIEIGQEITSGLIKVGNGTGRTGTINIGGSAVGQTGDINIRTAGFIRVGGHTGSRIEIGQEITSGYINIGNGTGRTGAITIGGSAVGQTGDINIRTAGAINIGGHAGSQITIGGSVTTGTINIGNALTTGNIVLGNNTSTNEVQIQNALRLLNKGSVTQITSATTAVTLNTSSGTITTVNQAIAAGGSVAFTFNNTWITTTSIILHTERQTGSGIAVVHVESVAAGSCVLRIHNASTVGLSNQVIISFLVV